MSVDGACRHDAGMALLSNITSLHWQPALNSYDVVVAESDIAQAIRVILTTPLGSNPHRPDFGSNLDLYIDYPVNQVVPHLVRESVEAIRKWEPRCTLVSVTPVFDGGHITLVVVWKLVDGIARTTEVAL